MPQRYARAPGVIETDLEHELVLLDPETQEMFSLNATGRCVWRALPAEGEAPLVAAVVAAYDVSPEAAEADVRRLLAELLEAGLIEARADGAGG
ncbi:MAG TPA: PqqD family protein [Longimicrobiales bacterium]